METINNMSERREIGLALHAAETAIGVGRRTVSELVSCEPVDTIAVEAERAGILEARLARNALRRDLEFVKVRETKVPGWIY